MYSIHLKKRMRWGYGEGKGKRGIKIMASVTFLKEKCKIFTTTPYIQML